MLSFFDRLASGSCALRHRIWCRAAQLLALWATLMTVSNAWALAPMCDAQGQTIAAPPELVVQPSGEIKSVKDCSPFERSAIAGVPLPERTSAFADLPPRVLPLGWRLPPLPVSPREPWSSASPHGSRPGYARSVFHPPCGC